MEKIFTKKLKIGDTIAIIAPSRSLKIVSKENQKIAKQRLNKIGLNVIFGKNVDEKDDFDSSSIKSRVKDLHDAFSNPEINAILTVIGGFNSNQLLKHLDYDLIKDNPKIFCGFSDITALNNAIYAKTGVISYSGPHYSSFGQKLYFDYTLEYFKKCLFSNEPFNILPSEKWSDDAWWKNQEERNLIRNFGWLIINEGKASGTILGANLCTFNLLQGTEYFPDINNSILFIEDDELSNLFTFDRDLQSLIHQPKFKYVKGLVIGRFQKKSKITDEKLIKIIKAKKEISQLPVIANVNFGHTDPKITFPIGGTAKLIAEGNIVEFKIIKH